jgi:hypothetical protein
MVIFADDFLLIAYFFEHLIGSGEAYPFSLKNMIMHEAQIKLVCAF